MTDFAELLQSALSPGYTLERELTGGGMSRVFVATDVALARKVVVKVLPPELAAGVNHERFRREIQVAARLQQPDATAAMTLWWCGDASEAAEFRRFSGLPPAADFAALIGSVT